MRIFVGGATGATGQAFVLEGTRAGLDLVLHVRPQTAARTPLGSDPRARVFDLGDGAALADALAGCDAVVSFIGTMRGRFAAGDTYATSDVGTTAQLCTGARSAGVPRFLLLSSLGAGGPGAYLRMKGECERLVRESGLRWTLFRPSLLVTPEGVPGGTHGARRGVPGAQAVFGVLGRVPGLGGLADDTRPIPLDVVARAFVRVLLEPLDGRVLGGRELWRIGA